MIYCSLIGLTLFVVRSSLFAPLRNLFPPLLACAQCSGFWIGFSAGASGTAKIIAENTMINALSVGFAVSFLSLLADGILLQLLGDPSERNDGP